MPAFMASSSRLFSRPRMLKVGLAAIPTASILYVAPSILLESPKQTEKKEYIDWELRSAPASGLLRSYLVYTTCRFPWIVDHSNDILGACQKIPVIAQVSQFIVRHTFFSQFVGGDTAAETLPAIRSLRASQKGALLAYSVEVSESEAAGSGLDNEEGLKRLREKSARDHVEETIRCINVAGKENRDILNSGPAEEVGSVGSTWVAIKLTGLMSDPACLHRASTTILSLRSSVLPALPTSQPSYYPGTPIDAEFALITSHAGSSPLVLPAVEGGIIPGDLEKLRELYKDMRSICLEAKKEGVRIIIDAEHSWYQPGIDAFAVLLSKEFNALPSPKQLATVTTITPLIYNTYQAYLVRNPEHLKAGLAHAQKYNYALGVKLVRGAYHGQETARWYKLGMDRGKQFVPPVWQTKPETDACYNSAIDWILDLINEDAKKKSSSPKVGVLFGTHNEDSVRHVVNGLAKRGMAATGGIDGKLIVDEEVRKRVCIGQLYGMCDALTYNASAAFEPKGTPMVLKYVPYGALAEVLPYLGRRAVENKTVLAGSNGAKAETDRVKKEMLRRWLGIGHTDA